MRTSRIAILSSMLLLAACSSTTQTTSGRDWLAASPKPKTVDMSPGNIDAAVRDAANVEPTLRFPARIGIARIDRARLTSIPSIEAQAWTDAAARLGDAYGEFVPVSPLVEAMVAPPTSSPDARDLVDAIRLASARQHLDAVLIYESDATSDTRSNPLSLADWTLIGAFVLPGQNVKAQGVAQAILIDVRNGYPYGTVQSDADDTSAAARFETNDTGRNLQEKVRTQAVMKLAGETEGMMRNLRHDLALLDRKPGR